MQQMAKNKDNEKEAFDNWLKTNAPSRKHKNHKMNTFSEEMLKAVNSRGRDIRSWDEYLAMAKLCYDKRMLHPYLPLVKKIDFVFYELTLGTGAFSKVILVKHIETETYYSAKLLKKALLVKRQNLKRAYNEKLILQCIRFVFTIHLEFFFEDDVYLFLILPLIPGGDMFSFQKTVTRLTEDYAKFYSAQILLALEYIHYLGLIFRDLKPENVLIDSDGYLKLADFGLCKAVELRTYTFCGTSKYIAPEMLTFRGYGKSIDWWTFGVFLYELCAGYTPFDSKLEAKIYDNISRCKYKMPYHFSSELKDLIKNLLQLDLTRRYGNLKNGVDDIKQHKFYNDMQWIMLLNREIQPPCIPVISVPDDTSHSGSFRDSSSHTATLDLYSKEFADF